MKILWVTGAWRTRTKGETDPQVTYSGCRSLDALESGRDMGMVPYPEDDALESLEDRRSRRDRFRGRPNMSPALRMSFVWGDKW